MTAPVDIAAAVELVVESVPPRELAANLLASMANSEDLLAAFGRIRARLGLGDDDPTTTEDAVYALADERRDIEQRTAEAIAEMLDERRRDIEASKMFGATEDDPVSIACDAYYDGRIQAFTDAAALVRSRRTP